MYNNILWIVGGNEGFGVRRATLSLAAALHTLGWRVDFVALADGGFSDEIRSLNYTLDCLMGKRAEEAGHHTNFYSNVWKHFRQQWQCRGQLEMIVRTRKPEWLHVRHNHLLFMAGFAARATKIPAYWHLPNTINRRLPFNLQAISYQLFCRWAGIRPLGNSKHTADSLGYRFVNTRVLHLGIDPIHFNPRAEFPTLSRAEVGLDESTPVFAIIARVIPAKAQDRVLDAVIELLRDGEHVQLVMVGGPVESEFYHRLQARVTAAGVGHAVKFVPPVSDPRPWFALADVIINSRTGAEPFGLTIVEAMLMERPVLACRAGGPGETVLDGETGWLIDDLSVAGYKAGIARALNDRARWRAMGRAGCDRAMKYFTIAMVAKKYLELAESDSR